MEACGSQQLVNGRLKFYCELINAQRTPASRDRVVAKLL
jgi:hypothetical protein